LAFSPVAVCTVTTKVCSFPVPLAEACFTLEVVKVGWDGLALGFALFEGFADGLADPEGLADAEGFPLCDGEGEAVGFGVGLGFAGGGVTVRVGTPARTTGSVSAFAQAASPISTATPSTSARISLPPSHLGLPKGAGEVTGSP